MHYNVHKTFTGPHGGGGPGSGPIAVTQAARALPARPARRRRTATDYRARLRPAQIDRPRAQLLRQRRHPAPRLLLHPHARARGPAARERERGPQRELSAQPASSMPTRCRTATAACTSSSPAPQTLRREKRHQRDGHRQAAARLRLPRPDGLFPAGRARSADDRADGDREQGNARRLRRRAAEDHRGRCGRSCTKRRTRCRSAGRTR